MLAPQAGPLLARAAPCATGAGLRRAPPCATGAGLRRAAAAAQRPATLAARADAAWKTVTPVQVKGLLDKGYTILDIRTGAEYRSGNGLHWSHLPLAEEAADGTPVMNPNFTKAFDAKFMNKMSRVIVACQDGGGRSEIACKLVTDLGYTAIATIEGGIEEYLKVSPLTATDRKARINKVLQPDAGVKYGYGSDRGSDTA